MAANQYGIDVGQLFRDKENIQGTRTRNKMAALQLGEAEREIEQRPIREAAEKKRNIMVTDLKQKAVGGDQAARDKLLVIDSTTKDFITHIDNADAKQAKQAQENIDQMGRMLGVVQQVTDPVQREAKYQQAKSMLPEATQAKMAKNYNENEVDLTLAKLNLMADVAEHKVLAFGGEDILYKDGKEIGRANRPVKSGTGTGGSGSGGLKSGDESLMYRQAAERLGGMFDAAGNLQALDPETRTKVQSIATEATRIYQNTPGISRTEAVTKSIEAHGMEVGGVEGEQPATQYTEGQRAQDANGNIMVYTNGQWTPE